MSKSVHLSKRPSLVLGIAALGLVSCGGSPQAREAKFLKRGEALVAQKDFGRAMLEFHNAAQAMPRDPEPFYRQGLAYLAMSNPRMAFAAFRKALDLNPKHAGARLELDSLTAVSGDKGALEVAEKDLRSLVTSPQQNAEALDTLALTEWKLGKPEEAARLLEDALEKFPADLKSAEVLARLKLSRKDLKGAEAVLQKAADNAPKSAPAALALGRLYVLMHRVDLAEPEFQRALANDPKYAPALLSLALLQVAGRRLDEAEQTYKQLAYVSEKTYQPLYGSFLFQRGKRDAALAELQRLAKQDAGDRAARSRLVTALVLMNKTPDAEKILADALKRNPKDTEALLQQSELRLRAGDLTAAEKDLNEVIRLQPDSAVAHFDLAKIKRRQGMILSERQELNQALFRNPTYLPARIALSRSFLLANESKSALDLLDQTPPPQKDSQPILIERNWALLGVGRTKEAREGIDRGLSAARTPELVVQDGTLKLVERNYAGARLDAEELLRQDPENLRAVGILVNSYGGEKQLASAVSRLREMVAQRPKSLPLQLVLGQVLMQAGNRPEARKVLETATAAEPKFAAAQIALAQLDLADDRLDAARQRAIAVITMEPRNARVLLLAADIEMKAGNHQAALSKYRAALEIDGSNALALNNVAYLLAPDNPDEALKFAQRAMEMAPDNAAVQDTLGWVYYRKAIYQTAVVYLQAAVAKESTPRRQFHLGMAYLKAGDKGLGQRTILAAVKQDPSLPKTEQGW